MYRIVLVTTIGCDACRIAENNILAAIGQFKVDISLEIKDFHDFERKYQKLYQLKDYPTALYTDNDKLLTKAVGSYPKAVYLRWMDMYFK